MRRTALLLACLFPFACDKPPPEPVGGTGTAKEEPAKKREPVLAETGIKRIQESHDLLAREVAKCEAALEAGETVDGRIARELLKGVQNLVTAAEIAVRQDTQLGLKSKHAVMVSNQAKMRQDWVEAEQEVAQMRQILDGVAKGTDEIPEGFTESEIRDRLKDWEKMAKERKEELETYSKEMAKVEEVLALPADQIPAATESLFARELQDLKLLQERAARVVAKATDPQ